jgi:cytochrome c oxidase assembly protein subunit 15
MQPREIVPASSGSDVLAVGFGTTVAMWAVGYLARLPAVALPSPVLLLLLLGCLVAGGVSLGRHAGASLRRGALTGMVSGLLNLLVLGGVLADHGAGVPTALVWIPGSIGVAAALVALGTAIGRRFRASRPRPCDWTAVLVQVAGMAVLLLLGLGGLVTSAGAGLAVVDWPNTFGYNMFLYPFSRMTGGVYYEHAHRLFGALVGLTVLAAAIRLQVVEPRRSVRWTAWAIVAAVAIQGLLGGLRVTGGLTLATDPERMRPSLALAIAHGVLGQLIFGATAALAAATAPSWKAAPPPASRRSGSADRRLGGLLLALLVGQLVLGAAQRHLGELLILHVVVGVAFVGPLALHVGFRAWGLHGESRPLKRLGLGLVVGVAVQVALGLGALAARLAAGEAPGARLALGTAHQVFGAVLLALAVQLVCWTVRSTARPRSTPVVTGWEPAPDRRIGR